MTDRNPNVIATVGVGLAVLALGLVAYARPEYFTNPNYLGGLLLLECLAAAVWLYKRVFFPLVIVTFLLAGLDLQIGSIWTVARWLILGVGAVVGAVIMLKERHHRFGSFHALALFAVLAAVVSTAVSRYTLLSLSKVSSLFLLFLYGAAGARLAVSGRENRFLVHRSRPSRAYVARPPPWHGERPILRRPETRLLSARASTSAGKASPTRRAGAASYGRVRRRETAPGAYDGVPIRRCPRRPARPGPPPAGAGTHRRRPRRRCPHRGCPRPPRPARRPWPPP